ncbi:hypothetical protein P879_01161 [Paragonimus westermani]|uniref:RING-type domain-containing protein n=1 Tax=Paragonimus westermani TaxID=34504 RepID=A0A8T0DJR8_9TREM|nr:hypothetical protein P879_01161 [Paragonimus westermani]
MGNCFGIFGDAGPLLDNMDTDDSTIMDVDDLTTQTPVYHPHPGVSIPAGELTEEEQLQIVKRMDMLQFLPLETYVPASKDKLKECIICMCELKLNDCVRFLPCLHSFHRVCIDEWLMRSLSCPSCLRPVDLFNVAHGNDDGAKSEPAATATDGRSASSTDVVDTAESKADVQSSRPPSVLSDT